jgi:hypothetical protein
LFGHRLVLPALFFTNVSLRFINQVIKFFFRRSALIEASRNRFDNLFEWFVREN